MSALLGVHFYSSGFTPRSSKACLACCLPPSVFEVLCAALYKMENISHSPVRGTAFEMQKQERIHTLCIPSQHWFCFAPLHGWSVHSLSRTFQDHRRRDGLERALRHPGLQEQCPGELRRRIDLPEHDGRSLWRFERREDYLESYRNRSDKRLAMHGSIDT